MRIKFGTDGWRGVIARDFTFDNLSLVAQATMDYLKRTGAADRGLVIGYDRRFLSRHFARRVAEIAAGNAIRVRLSDHFAPTPAVSWAVREGGAGASGPPQPAAAMAVKHVERQPARVPQEAPELRLRGKARE